MYNYFSVLDIGQQLKKSGLVILDAHVHPLDILLTARHLRKKFKAHVTMPIAGYVFHVPIMKNVVNWFKKTYKIDFLPVYRKEELNPKNLALKFLCSFYPKKIDHVARHKANKKFIETSTKLSYHPGEIVIIAPYGSTTLFGKSVKNGVKKILLESSNYLTTITRWRFKGMKFKTYFGQLSTLRSSFDREKIETKIQQDFSKLPIPAWIVIFELKLLKLLFVST